VAGDHETSFVATVTTGAGRERINVQLDAMELEIWGVHAGVPWMKISDFISKGATTQNSTEDGRKIIVNRSMVAFVTCDNPRQEIAREAAPHFKNGAWTR